MNFYQLIWPLVGVIIALVIVYWFTRRERADIEKLVARRLASVTAEASKDREQMRTVIASMAEGLIAIDHQQRILLMNDNARQLLKVNGDARGHLLWDVVTHAPLLKAVSEVSLTGQRKTITLGPIEGRHLQVTVSRLATRPAGFVIVVHDVTEATQYEQLRKDFVANVSHELRTPLTMIQGYVETLLDGALDDRARAVQYLTTAQRHAHQLTDLVQDLLELSRLESAAPAARQRIDIAALVKKAAELEFPAVKEKSQEFSVNVAKNLPFVNGRAAEIERAVGNLLQNAIKYTPANGKITVEAIAENSGITIRVIDNGIGIDPQEQPRIFERFYRVDKSRSREMGGTGLGLSIVKHAVQSHGGAVSVVSAPGKGSTFTIWLPATATGAAAAGKNTS